MGATVGARLPLLVEPGELVANINPLPRSWLNAVQATISEANAKTVGLEIVQRVAFPVYSDVNTQRLYLW
jgi:CHASE2 domain-containing sensor protein